MPQNYTFPGVYIEEIPSGVRTIAGVSTSDTAFVDFFKKGPVNDPQRITSFGDFERIFGGLDRRSAASYAIQQYYLNGGSVAYVVRVVGGTGDTASVTLTDGTDDLMVVSASSPGTWANNHIRVSLPTGASTGQFNLTVREVNIADPDDASLDTIFREETFFNLSTDPASGRFAPSVVNGASALVTLSKPTATTSNAAPNTFSPDTGIIAGGSDGDEPNPEDNTTDWATDTGADALNGSAAAQSGIHALDKIVPRVFNILCIPAAADLDEDNMRAVYSAALAYINTDKPEGKQRAFLILDIPASVKTPENMDDWLTANASLSSKNAAVYYPRVMVPDALQGNTPRSMAVSGTMAGIYARTDAQRGIWKAPAGTEAILRNAAVEYKMTDGDNGGLNPLGLNALRSFPVFGDISWGARTMDGADQKASEWKYVPVRRTALFIEESLYQGLKWVVFEPNDEPLWAQIRLNVGTFMNSLFRQGAFQGKTSREAYFVKCDKETTTQNDIDRGIVNIVVGFAPLKPAEFVVIKIQQIAGQLQV